MLFLLCRIIGLCLLQNEMCPLFLNRHVLKYILGRKIGWHDLAFFDPVMYESLRQLVLDSEHKDASVLFAALDMNFFVQLGAEEVNLKSNGMVTCTLRGLLYVNNKSLPNEIPNFDIKIITRNTDKMSNFSLK